MSDDRTIKWRVSVWKKFGELSSARLYVEQFDDYFDALRFYSETLKHIVDDETYFGYSKPIELECIWEESKVVRGYYG